jgi:ABC-type glutathione transport system ATPase component
VSEPLLELRDVVKHYPRPRTALFGPRPAPLRAVDGVSLAIARGEALGLVGESGSGKSTLARLVVGLERATSGTIRLDGREVTTLRAAEWRPLRRRVQMVFQDPHSSLDPRQTASAIVAEPLAIHRLAGRRERRKRALELLEAVGLAPAQAGAYPHELSGGQRQRVGIAAALASEPELIVADEPVSALDMSVQAQILNLFMDLQNDLGVASIFITHDLGVVEHVSHDVAVMYRGEIVETGSTETVMSTPQHDYTRALLAAIPRPR